MFNFKNRNSPMIKYNPNDPSTFTNKNIPGLSKHWRYATLDYQNNNNNNLPFNYNINNYNNNNNNSNCISINPNYHLVDFSRQRNPNEGPNDITLEISYDNFYALGVDMMKKRQYAEDLRKQIEEKKQRENLERQKKRLQDIDDDLRNQRENQ